MRIALVAPECDPLVKVGGLADVVASLPRALKRQGHDVEIYVPKFGVIPESLLRGATRMGSVNVNSGSLPGKANLYRLISRDIPVNLVECEDLYEREPEPYGEYPDDPARWAFFSLAVLEALSRQEEIPDVIHLHDRPLGFFPVYRSLNYKDSPIAKTAILFTAHNLAHAGKFSRDWLPQLGLPGWLFDKEQIEFFGSCSMLKAGLLWATMVGTVSPTYAREIVGEALGCGMDGILRKRSYDLVGVLNGIDTQVWDPAKAAAHAEIPGWEPFTEDKLSARDGHRQALRKELGLKEDVKGPIFGFVGIFSAQRGMGALLAALPMIAERGGQVAILGDNAEAYASKLDKLTSKFPGLVATRSGFDARLAKRIYAGSDYFLMPSKFEPCGLSQMIACRYGAVPIVSRTGGLADTIRDAFDKEDGNGISFPAPVTMNDDEWQPAAIESLGRAIGRAFELHADKARFDAVRRRAMRCDFSWERSARQYEDVYAEAIRREGGLPEHYGP